MARVAINSWSLRDVIGDDLPGTLAKVAVIGFEAVEPVSLWGHSPAEFRKIAEDAGLIVCSTMDPGVDWDDFDTAIAGCRTLGLDTICHGGFGEDTTLDELKAEAERINAGIEKLKSLGMSMFMHNHCGEFEAVFAGRPLFDVVMELCPKLTTEFDVYWAQAAGTDPVAVARQYAGRMPMIHLRDGPVEPKTPQVPLGQGAVDIVGCVKATDPAVLKWVIVELCQVEGDMLAALAQSYDFIISQGLV